MKNKKDKFSTFEAMKKTEVERSRFFHWMRDGFLPEGELVKWGRGYKTLFSLYDLYSIAVFKECVDFSLSRKVAKRYVNYIDWDFIINKKSQFMVVQNEKKSVKNEDGKYEIQVSEEPEFYDNLLEMVYPKHLIEQFTEAMASSEVLGEQDDQGDIKEMADLKTLIEQDEQQVVYQALPPYDSEKLGASRQSHIGFFVDLLKIMETVNKRV